MATTLSGDLAGETIGRRQLVHTSFVVRTAGRDLVWRARRWLIATIGTAVAFCVALLLSGFLASFASEATNTVEAVGGDGFVVRATASGPFTSLSPITADHLAALQADPGVRSVTPLVSTPYTARFDGVDGPSDVQLMGRADGPAPWPVTEGRAIAAPGEVVIDDRSPVDIGEVIMMGNKPFTVVGHSHGRTVVAGRPVIWLSVADAQGLVLGGQPLVNGFVVEGKPTVLPEGTQYLTRGEARADLLRLVRPIMESITTFRLLMWVVSSAIVASVLYLTALDRVRDFAVFKATGTRDRELVLSLLAQSILLALVASAFSTGLAYLLAPTFPTPVLFTSTLLILAPVIAMAIGALGSIAGVRRAITTDPATAFGGA